MVAPFDSGLGPSWIRAFYFIADSQSVWNAVWADENTSMCDSKCIAPEGTEPGGARGEVIDVALPLNSTPHPPRRQRTFDFVASQQSSGSDDQACVGLPSFLYASSSLHILISVSLGSIQVAIAHQLMASREKKRKEHKNIFFQVAKNKLTAECSSFRVGARRKFILDYAALEDTIRALWMEIKKEEQTLIGYRRQEIAKKQHAANDVIRTAMETTGYVALGQIKESCHAGRQVVDTLMPPAV
ncbi:hypothetical protein DFH08DRAFT_825750 [Mycena albidolilacea]|uniref:Uncharacterized protein n=1 Tax=Mycena albidolilacea TaxID=1033008 RepID=A0AAD7E8X5_9AGAR|nr:hypothetical protein DFH08DRAFT_825750 [Mycena albidolilacea]